LFSLAPVAVALRTNVAAVVQRDGRRPRGVMHYRARAALVVAQVALGVILLVAAELMVRTFVALQRVDPGFRTDGMLSLRVPIGGPPYRSPDGINAFARTLQATLGALPGVTGIGAVTHLPFDHVGNWAGPYTPQPGASDSATPLADYRAISPGYFETIGARLVDGRLFTEADDRGGQPVAIVDEILARRLWRGQRAIGRELAVDPESSGHNDRSVTVVGVVQHLRLHTLIEDGREQVYFPMRQVSWTPIAFVVRASGDPAALAPAIRQAVAQLAPSMPVYDVRPLADYAAKARATQRFTMMLAATFAVVALILACVGVYGLVAYAVAQRRHEFGVRLALGAQPSAIIGLVLSDGMRLTVAGLVMGVVGGVAGTRLLQNQLFGVSSHDVASYAIAVPALGACAVVACLLPAWRAGANSPVIALRGD
jgi:predicted permease